MKFHDGITYREIPLENFNKCIISEFPDIDFWAQRGKSEGCYTACLATLLDIPPMIIPIFYSDVYSVEEAWELSNEFASRYDYKLNYTTDFIPSGWSIAGGRTSTGYKHATLCLDGDQVFDPWPNGNGLNKIRGFSYLT
jgi:hypothetical protein